MQSIVHELKYKQNPQLGHYLGRLCGENIKGSNFVRDIDLLVPVPLHPKRERQRGYNQSMEICKGISAVTGIPIDYATLRRVVDNKTQTKNSRFDRWKNVEDIFLLANAEAFAGKHILLVDDVITTGSTIESCAKEILKSVDSRISIYALATAN